VLHPPQLTTQTHGRPLVRNEDDNNSQQRASHPTTKRLTRRTANLIRQPIQTCPNESGKGNKSKTEIPEPRNIAR
ncbi:Hypothetical predicted protein, partial [Pelobates cultripes]